MVQGAISWQEVLVKCFWQMGHLLWMCNLYYIVVLLLVICLTHGLAIDWGHKY
jgi:hypothetical protein